MSHDQEKLTWCLHCFILLFMAHLHPDIRESDITPLKLSDLPEPQRKLVVRPPNADPDVETPEYMRMIPESDDPRLPFKEDIMVRQEYHNVLAAILWFLYRQSQVAKLKDDFPQ